MVEVRQVLFVNNRIGLACFSSIFCKKKKSLIMSDTTVIKVDSQSSPTGEMGQKYLAMGKKLSMRLWEAEQPSEAKPPSQRPYETVGYAIQGKAELHIEGQMVLLESGSSWIVPEGASHTYKILEPFTAVEATSPPAGVHGRDNT
jgi:quercetin dioxygenase-like cupin family protein